MTMRLWEPARELQELAERMNRLFDGRLPLSERTEWTLPLDVKRGDDEITIKASVPGVKPGDIDVSIEHDTLVIKGQTSSEKEETKEGWFLRERRSGSFFRSLVLPDSVDADKATVTLKDGELTIVVPVAKAQRRKKLAIKSGA